MKIIKYEKRSNGKYRVYFEDNQYIDLYENTIVDNNLLYKKDVDSYILDKINYDNNFYSLYDKCLRYISVRLRSIYEIKNYLKKYDIDSLYTDLIIDKLIDNNLLDDERFSRAFIRDKLKFSSMGIYKIRDELKKHCIDSAIIDKCIGEVDDEEIISKIDKQVNKLIKLRKNKDNLRNHIYLSLISLGYPSDLVVSILNKYNL